MEGEDEIEVGEVDCGTNKPLCSKVKIGSYPTFKLFYNGEEVARYREMMKGSATNLAPWLIIVAASSTDREFTSKLVMGNGVHLKMLPRGRVYRYPPGRNVPDVSMGAADMGPVPYDIGNGMQLRDAAISQPIPIGALASALANASPTEQRTMLPRGRVYRYPPGRNVPDVSIGAAGMGPVPYDIGNGILIQLETDWVEHETRRQV